MKQQTATACTGFPGLFTFRKWRQPLIAIAGIGLALFVGVHSVPAQITNLGIAPAPGGQSVLYWPVSTTNYVLQTVTNLTSTNWVTATDAVPMRAVTVSNTSPARFFRLSAVPASMAIIPAGVFTMGDALDGLSDAVPISVTVSAFYMDVNLVSLSQWQSVYSYATSHGYGFVNAGSGTAANHPVQTVNWYDCVKWSNARSVQAGLTPCYYTDGGFTLVYTNGQVTTLYPNWAASGYRLPTEAEWEKAARGGLSGQRFPWGNLIGESQANYVGSPNYFTYDLGPSGYNAIGNYPSTLTGTTPVGTFPANGYGLYDMAGNVGEWCWDWYMTPYAGGTDPHGPTGPLTYRVVRGGVWSSEPYFARCAVRDDYFRPNLAGDSFGFRCVRGL
jgi:formylglycine-generating enzyme required for sulfatase activity